MNGDDLLFDRDQVVVLLHELSEELEARGVRGNLFLVGGAAMAIAYGRDRLTQDVDAVFEPKTVIYEAATAVALRRGVRKDWLNDAVKGFLLGVDPDATTFMDEPGLSVQIASPRYLFVLKALAARVDRDAEDLITLYRLSGFETIEEALSYVEASAPAGMLKPKTGYLLRELLADG